MNESGSSPLARPPDRPPWPPLQAEPAKRSDHPRDVKVAAFGGGAGGVAVASGLAVMFGAFMSMLLFMEPWGHTRTVEERRRGEWIQRAYDVGGDAARHGVPVSVAAAAYLVIRHGASSAVGVLRRRRS
jgi:hypothetical protein